MENYDEAGLVDRLQSDRKQPFKAVIGRYHMPSISLTQADGGATQATKMECLSFPRNLCARQACWWHEPLQKLTIVAPFFWKFPKLNLLQSQTSKFISDVISVSPIHQLFSFGVNYLHMQTKISVNFKALFLFITKEVKIVARFVREGKGRENCTCGLCGGVKEPIFIKYWTENLWNRDYILNDHCSEITYGWDTLSFQAWLSFSCIVYFHQSRGSNWSRPTRWMLYGKEQRSKLSDWPGRIVK